VHGVEEPGGIQIGQLALVVGGKGGAGLLQPVEVTLEFGSVGRRVEIGEVPFRQIAEVLAPGRGIGIEERADRQGALLCRRPGRDARLSRVQR
jgi:hypothetical protein